MMPSESTLNQHVERAEVRPLTAKQQRVEVRAVVSVEPAISPSSTRESCGIASASSTLRYGQCLNVCPLRVVALASTRLLSRILYGVSATDMSTFISAFFVLLLLVGLATLTPA